MAATTGINQGYIEGEMQPLYAEYSKRVKTQTKEWKYKEWREDLDTLSVYTLFFRLFWCVVAKL